MTHEVIRHLLDDYVTGDLPEDARGPVADHIAACEICHAEVESLKGILSRAADLPKSIDPPAGAWLNIRAAIERDKEAVATNHGTTGRDFWRQPYLLAAAVVLVAVLSSGGTALYMSSRSVDGSSSGSPADTASEAGAPATFAAFAIEENNYLRNVAVLQDLLDQQSASLAPETVAQLKSSLRTIDEAILEARNALARDPANKMLIEMLSGTYRQKVDLLRRTAEMTRGS